MPTYFYTVSVDHKNTTLSGSIHAENRQEAEKMLAKKHRNILLIREERGKRHWWEWSSGLSQKDLLLLTKRVSDMQEQGFSVMDALKTIELQAENPTLKDVAGDLRKKVELGNSFSDTLASYPKYFSNVYRSLVKVGEESGTLAKTMKYLEKQVSNSYNLRKEVISTLTYPALIITMMILIGTGTILFLIPFLKDVLGSLDENLPRSTQLLIQFESILRTKWWLLLLSLAGIIGSVRLALRNKGIRRMKDTFFFHLPILGKLIRMYNSAQIIRTFATLNKTGIPLIESLTITATVPKNVLYQEALEHIKQDVEKGEILSSAIQKQSKRFSPLVIESVKLGEQAGNLADSLSYLAELFEDELKDSLKTLTTLIQPLLLIIIGMMVAGLAISVITPLQKLPSLMQK